jgi:hypothetical protein
MIKERILQAALVVAALGVAATVHAQAPDSPWSVEFGIGWDNSISGNINSSAIGSINGQTVVITKNRYEDVYGTGLHMRFGGGYMLDEVSEVRGIFVFQSLDADLTPMGEIGTSTLYGQYSDYQSLGLDFGYRRYTRFSQSLQGYSEALVGLGFVDKTDVVLVAPAANVELDATDFFDQTAAFTLGTNVGLLIETNRRPFDFFGQIGLRYVTGMAEVDQLVGTSLDTINDKSARWTFPFVVGFRARF